MKKKIMSNSDRKTSYIKRKQGTKDETVELHTNFKTMIYHHLRDLVLLNELNEEEAQRIKEFKSRVPSFNSFNTLFFPNRDHPRLRRIISDFVAEP